MCTYNFCNATTNIPTIIRTMAPVSADKEKKAPSKKGKEILKAEAEVEPLAQLQARVG